MPEKTHEHATVARRLELRCPIQDLAKALPHLVFQDSIVMIASNALKVPGKHADYKRDVIDKQVALMQKRDIWKKPAKS